LQAINSIASHLPRSELDKKVGAFGVHAGAAVFPSDHACVLCGEEALVLLRPHGSAHPLLEEGDIPCEAIVEPGLDYGVLEIIGDLSHNQGKTRFSRAQSRIFIP